MYQPYYLQAPVFHTASGINTKSIPYNRLCCYVPTWMPGKSLTCIVIESFIQSSLCHWTRLAWMPNNKGRKMEFGRALRIARILASVDLRKWQYKTIQLKTQRFWCDLHCKCCQDLALAAFTIHVYDLGRWVWPGSSKSNSLLVADVEEVERM